MGLRLSPPFLLFEKEEAGDRDVGLEDSRDELGGEIDMEDED